MADTIKFTNKKFLDYDGLKKVFELLKNKYGVDIEALKKLVGSWTNTASEESVIEAIEEIRKQIGDFDSAQLESIVAAIVTNQGDIKDLQDAIADMDYTGATGGSVITQVTQEDGKVTATAANLTSEDKTVTVNGLDLAVNIDEDTIVKDSNGKLSVSASATAVSGKEAIEVGNATEGGKEVSLKIDSTDKVLSQSDAGLLASLELKYTPKSDTANGKIELIGKDNTVISTFDTTDFTVDGFLDSVAWSTESGKENILVFTWNTTAGKSATEVDLTKYIDTYTNGDGLNLADKKFSVKIKDGDKYLTVDENGVASKGIDDAISTAVGDLEEQLLGDAEELTDFGKVEDEINDLKDSLKTTIEDLDADVTSTGGEFVTVQVTEEDGVITAVTVTETDIASETALNAEIAARKAVDGQNGQTYAANDGTTYISGATSLNDADVKLDAALKDVADKVDAIETDYIKYADLQPLTTDEILELFNGTPASGQP